ncbi:MAG: hypothetical protein EOO07_37275 [Chitinophagaceae bacterium]|nr:MAG: hypothetical protein EOO07_37275 [Chitinophagaceae bacterium]
MRLANKFLFISLLCVMSSGCATKVLKVTVPNSTQSEPIKGYVKIIKVTDLRGFQRAPSDPSIPSIEGDMIDKKALTEKSIGRMRHGLYHAALWNYTLEGKENIYGVCKNIVTSSLITSGYKVVSADQEKYNTAIPVEIEIVKFWAWMQPKFNIDLHFDGELVVKSTDAKKTLDINATSSHMLSTGFAGAGAWTKVVNEGVQKLDKDIVIKIKNEPSK